MAPRPPAMGVNINDGAEPFTDWILSGRKTVETRATDSLRPYVGRRVGIVRTGKGAAVLVGFATIGEPIRYESPAGFRADYGRHRVPVGSVFDCGAAGRVRVSAIGCSGMPPAGSRSARYRRAPTGSASGRIVKNFLGRFAGTAETETRSKVRELDYRNRYSGLSIPEFHYRNPVSGIGFRDFSFAIRVSGIGFPEPAGPYCGH